MHILYRLFSLKIVLPSAVGAMTLLQIGNANAQADLNIQSRIDAVTQPFQVQPIPLTPSGGSGIPEADRQPARRVIVRESTCFEHNHRCIDPDELDTLPRNPPKGRKTFTVQPNTAALLAELKSEKTSLLRKKEIAALIGLPIVIKSATPPNTKPGKEGKAQPVQPTTVKFIFPIGPQYESNATKSDALPHADTSIALGGGFQFTTQGFRNLDVIGVSAGTTSTRYSHLAASSLDILSATAQYQLFLGAYDVTGTPLNLSHGSDLSTGQVTFNTLTFGLQNSTAFAPTFKAETLNLLTPTVVYSWQNLPLGSEKSCMTKLHPTPDFAAFCYYSDVNLSVGHTSSDNRLQENTNFGVSTTLGDRIRDTDLTAALAASMSGKVYDNVPGGRRDLLLQIGPKLVFAPASTILTSLGVTYNKNYSSVAAAEWHGWVVQSMVQFTFTPK